jgi:uncharacterized protein (TIGR02117 family)
MRKKIFKYLITLPIILVFLVSSYLGAAYLLSNIHTSREEQNKKEIAIYILTNGVHTDIVVPIVSSEMDWSKYVKFSNTTNQDSNFTYLAMGWGDKGFYLETPTWADLKFSVAYKAAFGLSTSAIHATFYKKMFIGNQCKQIWLSKTQYQSLITYIKDSFKLDSNHAFIHIPTSAWNSKQKVEEKLKIY